jgi:hypothetical protein
MPVGFFLQALLESSSGPFAPFGHHFRFNLTQWPRPGWFRIHPLPFGWLIVSVS